MNTDNFCGEAAAGKSGVVQSCMISHRCQNFLEQYGCWLDGLHIV